MVDIMNISWYFWLTGFQFSFLLGENTPLYWDGELCLPPRKLKDSSFSFPCPLVTKAECMRPRASWCSRLGCGTTETWEAKDSRWRSDRMDALRVLKSLLGEEFFRITLWPALDSVTYQASKIAFITCYYSLAKSVLTNTSVKKYMSIKVLKNSYPVG